MNIVTLLVACAGPEEGNADLIQTSFERFTRYLKLDNRGAYVFPHCTDVNMLPNAHGGKARELARALAELVGSPPDCRSRKARALMTPVCLALDTCLSALPRGTDRRTGQQLDSPTARSPRKRAA